MTKTLSLADDAYEALTMAKRPDESYSELARRLARLAAQGDIFARTDEPPAWSDAEAARLKASLYKARDQSRQPRTGAR